jgi:ankyrin repeat protein
MGAHYSKDEVFHQVCYVGDLQKLDSILENYEQEIQQKKPTSIDINSIVKDSTALFKALEARNVKIIQKLLKINKLKVQLTNPAFYCLEKKDKELLKIVLESREYCVHERNEKQENLLQFVMNNSYDDEFASIIISFMNPFEFHLDSDGKGICLFHEVCEINNVNIFKMVLNLKGINPNVCVKKTGDTPLILLIKKKQIEMIKELLKYCEVIASNFDNSTALHIAAALGDEEICKLLINSTNGDLLLNCKDCKMRTPLMIAIESKNFHLIELLSQNLDSHHQKMIIECCKNNEDVLKLLKFDSLPKENFSIQVASDIHLEFYQEGKDLSQLIIPSAPYLALLGDIGLPIKRQNYKQFLLDMSEKFEIVFVLAGNHEVIEHLLNISVLLSFKKRSQ